MQITFTQHATVRMQERGVTAEQVLHTLAEPLLTVSAGNGCLEARGFIERHEVKMLLRVVYVEQVVISVVTVIATSQFKRYGL